MLHCALIVDGQRRGCIALIGSLRVASRSPNGVDQVGILAAKPAVPSPIVAEIVAPLAQQRCHIAAAGTMRSCVASVVPGTPSTAICSGLPVPRGPAILSRMGTKSRETIYGASIRAAAERATEARKEADRLAVEAWNKRMLGFQGPAQPSPALGDAINAGFGYLEVKCLGCNTHQTVALDIVRRPKATPVHELERYMRCKDCSEVRGYPYKRSHLVALRATKITASDPPSTWWPGER